MLWKVEKDAVYLLTSKQALPLKPMPPNFRNHGNYVMSVAQLGRFLSEKAEEAGVYILSETSATKLLVEDRIVVGVRTGDKGRGRDGEPLPNFEPGSDVMAKATVLAEGTLGHLSMAAMDYFDLAGEDQQRWELGVKEVWEVPQAARPRDPHDGLAAAQVTALQRVRRQLHLPDGRGQGLHRLRGRARLHRRHLLGATTRSSSSRRTRSCRTSWRAASASPGVRRRSPPVATSRCRSTSRCPGC